MTDATTHIRRDHERISPTALVVAHLRSFSDIPYAKETAVTLGCEEAAKRICGDDLPLVFKLTAPLVEARYKCLNRLAQGHNNVLEIAVGTSVERGLSISDDPRKTYIGTDLPEMIEALKKVYACVSGPRKNYHLEPANALSYGDLKSATRHFESDASILVIHEGLWMYLTPEEQRICAENIRKLLERYGGSWVTPDILDQETVERASSIFPVKAQEMQRLVRNASALTGREPGVEHFSNRREAMQFFTRLGFKADYYPMLDRIGSVNAINKFWSEDERHLCESYLRTQVIWQLSLL